MLFLQWVLTPILQNQESEMQMVTLTVTKELLDTKSIATSGELEIVPTFPTQRQLLPSSHKLRFSMSTF